MSLKEDTNNKIIFKCKHCDNDDLRYMEFHSLNFISEQWKNSPYRSSYNYETMPKTPMGIHIRCAKCGKDSFIIPDKYTGTEWGNDIPEQCIISVKYEKPQFSAIQYVMNDEGFLDKIVLTANNEKISLITQQIIDERVGLSVIGKKQYELLLLRGLQEVGQTPPQAMPTNVPLNNMPIKDIQQNNMQNNVNDNSFGNVSKNLNSNISALPQDNNRKNK